MLLMIDNFDSFTYNLVHYFQELGQVVVVVKNNEMSLSELIDLSPRYLVVSPGPCTPKESGISLQAIAHFAGRLPILGVCLGHQCIAEHFGGRVVRASHWVHGKSTPVHHGGKGIFENLKTPFEAGRYHSLVVNNDSLPDELEITAWTQSDGGTIEYIMGLQHKTLPIEGVQFHPESILSECGHDLLANFLKLGASARVKLQ